MNATADRNPPADARAEARDLAGDVLGRAIARWHEAAARSTRAAELARADPSAGRWAALEAAELVEAERALVRAILATAPDDLATRREHPERWRWPARGVADGERTYLAVPRPDRAGDVGGPDGPDLMRLVAVDRGDVLDLAGGLDVPVVEVRTARREEPEPLRPECFPIFLAAVRHLGEPETIRRLINPPAPAREGCALINPIDPPTAADLEAMQALPRDVVGRAVAGHHEAAARAERARELAELDPRLGRWAELEAEAAAVAEAWLARVVRAAVPGPGERATRGIRHEGALYLATPAAGDSGGWVLVVVDDSAVLDSAQGLAFEPAPAVGRPAWVDRVMAAAEELGESEVRRRAFGPGAGRGESWPDWWELVRVQIEELGRAEATRRMFAAG